MLKRMGTVAVALLAAAGWVWAAQQDRPEGPGPGREGGPGFRRGPDPMERLGLSKEQRAKIDALREKERAASRPLFEAARAAHEAFREALDAADPDPQTVGGAALAMHAAEKKARAAREASFEAIKAVLTPEQREKLEEMRPGGPGFGAPGFGPGPDGEGPRRRHPEER
ncbi:MAG TPA: periplasmic heavy metal sensor [Vicinamibacteria bacterium]